MLLVFGLVACGTDAEETGSTLSPAERTTPSTSSTTVGATTTVPPLGGEEIQFGPQSGDVLAVVGVAHDDVLNLRNGPGVERAVVSEIEPHYSELVAEGLTRQLENSFWIAVNHGDTGGWLNLAYVAYLGETTDGLDFADSQLGGDPVSDSVEDLGLRVAELYASDEPRSELVVTQAPDADVPDTVVVDVIGLGDDSVFGVRIRVVAQKTAGLWGLAAVEVTSLCGRGVSDGLCV
ncbi:MAG: hypothetical protein ACR2NL_10015 [Acidimicrobiia bacterium]